MDTEFLFNPQHRYEAAYRDICELVKSLHRKRCPVHHKGVRIIHDYDEHGVNAYISHGCCKEFAQAELDALAKSGYFDYVVLEDCEGFASPMRFHAMWRNCIRSSSVNVPLVLIATITRRSFIRCGITV